MSKEREQSLGEEIIEGLTELRNDTMIRVVRETVDQHLETQRSGLDFCQVCQLTGDHNPVCFVGKLAACLPRTAEATA